MIIRASGKKLQAVNGKFISVFSCLFPLTLPRIFIDPGIDLLQ
jgi:hypothetical protein